MTHPPKIKSSQTNKTILLVVPPFASVIRPALGVSQLKANLIDCGYTVEILYLNIDFAELIGIEAYESISQGKFLGDIAFSHILFDRKDEDINGYIQSIKEDHGMYRLNPLLNHLGLEANTELTELFKHLVHFASKFCNGVGLQQIVERDPWIVGFSSTFQQNCASLALIKNLKNACPEVNTIIGGANCEGEMGEELFACFDTLDFIGQGECDKSFIDLIIDLDQGNSGHGIPGILARGDEENISQATSLFRKDFDQSPYPDFSDYFARIKNSRYTNRIKPSLVMETSRGCWWGAKSHCTFCGLNSSTMNFRSKSPERVIEEMQVLVKRHDCALIEMVDNILDMNYFKTVLPLLSEKKVANIFFETKSNLSRSQVSQLARAGIKTIQPGIENLSSNNLNDMKKGVSALQNIQLLKWCSEDNIFVFWIYLYGFPDEKLTELPEIKEVMEKIHHLKPPSMAWHLNLCRFSPYHNTPEHWGISAPFAHSSYRHIYSHLSDESINRIAYFFDSNTLVSMRNHAAFNSLHQWIRHWKKMRTHSHLVSCRVSRYLIIIDTRNCAQRFIHILKDLDLKLYDFCDRIQGHKKIMLEFSDLPTATVTARLNLMVKNHIILESNGKYLSLATSFSSQYRKESSWIHIIPENVKKQKKLSSSLSWIQSLDKQKITFGKISTLAKSAMALMFARALSAITGKHSIF